MTKFISYYNLCPIHDTKEFLGLSPDREEGNIITTLGRNIIIIIKISDQKQVRSWSVLDKLSCKVVYDTKSQKYVGVFANNSIRCWDENSVDLNKIKKIRFKKSIADLVYTEDSEVVILYSDGSCAPLSKAITNRKEEPNAEEYSLVDSQLESIFKPAIVKTNTQTYLTYFTEDYKTKLVHFFLIPLHNESLMPISSPIKFILSRGKQNAELAGYTIVEGEYDYSLLTIWSDKRIFMMSLKDDMSPSDAPGDFVSMIDILKVENPLSIIGISKNCIAIYGGNTSQDGSWLILYNTQFKVVKAKQFFKIYFNFSRLWMVENYILIAIGQNLSVVSFRVSRELLSDMIGSQTSNNFDDAVGQFYINEEDEIEECITFAKNYQNLTKLSSIENKYAKKNDYHADKFGDGLLTPFQLYEKFEDKLKYICSRTADVELVTGITRNNDIEITLSSNFYDTDYRTDEIKILSKELEKCGASEHEISEKILTLALKADLPDDISACIRRYTNIPEKMIARVLKYALDLEESRSALISKHVDSKNEKLINNHMNDENENTPKTLENIDLLNLVLSCSYNETSLIPYIRKELNFNHVIRILNHLYNIITSESPCLIERPDTSFDFDEDIKIWKWFGLILDGHFQELVLSCDLNLMDILSKWSMFLIEYRKDMQLLEELSSILHNIVSCKKVINKDKVNKYYWTEEITLYELVDE